MGAWLLIVSVYSAIYFQPFDGASAVANMQNCYAARDQIYNFYRTEQSWVSVLAICVMK
jgi:hypothetical protein